MLLSDKGLCCMTFVTEYPPQSMIADGCTDVCVLASEMKRDKHPLVLPVVAVMGVRQALGVRRALLFL
eukprot:scaffold508673_cov11-Prasinocladus_malaysianus.AAC.1